MSEKIVKGSYEATRTDDPETDGYYIVESNFIHLLY